MGTALQNKDEIPFINHRSSFFNSPGRFVNDFAIADLTFNLIIFERMLPKQGNDLSEEAGLVGAVCLFLI
ncbi:hypothetical protein SUGI_0767000 [Cryptomeria japonica]|nr:hypothetical protein SUGI_0767000 [Cryptomeria japonica]